MECIIGGYDITPDNMPKYGAKPTHRYINEHDQILRASKTCSVLLVEVVLFMTMIQIAREWDLNVHLWLYVYSYRCCEDEGGPGKKAPPKGGPGPKKVGNPWYRLRYCMIAYFYIIF